MAPPSWNGCECGALGPSPRTTSADRVWLMLCDGVLRGGTREALPRHDRQARAPAGCGWILVQAHRTRGSNGECAAGSGREVHVLSDLQRTALESGQAVVPSGVRVFGARPGLGHPIAENRWSHGCPKGAAVIEFEPAR